MATSDRGLGAQLEKRMPTLARKSMNFMRDVYQLAASPTSERPHSSAANQSFQPSAALSQHFSQGYHSQYSHQRPHSSSNTSQYPHSPGASTQSPHYAAASPYLSPAPTSQSYFPQSHSNPVSPIQAPQQSFAWPAPIAAAIPPPLPPRHDHPPSYDSIQQPSPPVPIIEQGYQQPWEQQLRPQQQVASSHSPELPPRPSFSPAIDHSARPYQWQSPDSFTAVQEAAQYQHQAEPPSILDSTLPPIQQQQQQHHHQQQQSPFSHPFQAEPFVHQPNHENHQPYQTPSSYQTNSAPATIPQRPSFSKPFPSIPGGPYPGSNYPHQAPYEQPASASMPEQIQPPTPEIAVTPAAVELPLTPIHHHQYSHHPEQQHPQPYHQPDHRVYEMEAPQYAAHRPYSGDESSRRSGDAKPLFAFHNNPPTPLMAELPG